MLPKKKGRKPKSYYENLKLQEMSNNLLDISNNVSRIKEPTVLKSLIEGNKTLPNIKTNIKPIITMNDTRKIKDKK